MYRSLFSHQHIPQDVIYHGLSAELPWFAKLKTSKLVLTVHDLIFKIRPQDYRWHDRLSYNSKLDRAVRQAQIIVAISQKTKKDLLEFYKLEESSIEVLYQNCDPIFYQDLKTESGKLEALPENYWISVGSFNSRKNQESILKAYLCIEESKRIPLIFIGQGPLRKSIQESVMLSKLDRWIEFRTVESHETLAKYYRKAMGLLYPSLYEGFGIPAVEALACGIPVIGHRGTAVEEAAGAGGIFVNTLQSDELAHGIESIQSDSSIRNNLITKGKAHIQIFDEKKSIPRQKKIYEKLR